MFFLSAPAPKIRLAQFNKQIILQYHHNFMVSSRDLGAADLSTSSPYVLPPLDEVALKSQNTCMGILCCCCFANDKPGNCILIHQFI